MARKSLFTIFFLSGFCALVYEVTWSRIFVRIMGCSTYSSATTIAAFMTGLAVGGLLFGRISDKSKNPLRIYALLELTLFLFALIFPVFDLFNTWFYTALHPFLSQTPVLLTGLRFLLSFLTLFLPSCAMGGTLPLIVKFQTSEDPDFESGLSRLYGLNTAGAALGGISAGFLMIPAYGLRGTMLGAALINLLLAGWAFLISRVASSPAADKPAETSTPLAKNLVYTLFLSGFAGMSLEIALIRAFSFSFSSTVYAFSLTVSVFILLLALGSYFSNRSTAGCPEFILQRSLYLSGLFTIFLSPLIYYTPALLIYLILLNDRIDYATFLTWQAALIFLILSLPVFFLGGIFPMAAGIQLSNSEKQGTGLGRLYALNTAGDVLGSLAAGFFLIPLFGTQNTIYFSGLLLISCFFVQKRADKTSLYTILLGALPLLLIWIFPSWDYRLYSSMVFQRPERFQQLYDEQVRTPNSKLSILKPLVKFQADGVEGYVNVFERMGSRFLVINGKVDASDDADMPTQVLVGQLPCLMHKNPKSVLLIGWGSGVSAYSASLHHPENFDAVELIREVVEASRLFEHVNHGVFKQTPPVIQIEDGRNFMATTRSRYDVIISQPTNLWVAGVGNLFTREFFRDARKHLNPGGILCQWIQSYEISEEDVKSVLRAQGSIFPYSIIFTPNDYDLLILSCDRIEDLSIEHLKTAFSEKSIRENLSSIGMDSPEKILALELLSGNDLKTYAGKGELNTDDHPVVEFRSPYSLFSKKATVVPEMKRFPSQEPKLAIP
ncbi:MAG: fused MFS/spermidine synthase [Candidatus Wallbacteria bacterium]|nr:fused MFS/spermidine synthase [Candidatus Wallbacteria bacterium]